GAIELLKRSRPGQRDLDLGQLDYPEQWVLMVADFASVQAAVGDVDGAKDTATIISAANPHDSGLIRTLILARIAEGQAEAGDSVGAKTPMADVLDAGWSSTAEVRATSRGAVLSVLRKIGWY